MTSPQDHLRASRNDALDRRLGNYLRAALDELLQAGHSSYELLPFGVDRFGYRVVPHLNALQQQIRDGRVQVAKLHGALQTAAFGLQVGEAEREQMIREAAYLRAEQRGFRGGDPLDDWLCAEQDIDARLQQQREILASQPQASATANTIGERELRDAAGAVSRWLAAKWPSRGAKAPTARNGLRRLV